MEVELTELVTVVHDDGPGGRLVVRAQRRSRLDRWLARGVFGAMALGCATMIVAIAVTAGAINVAVLACVGFVITLGRLATEASALVEVTPTQLSWTRWWLWKRTCPASAIVELGVRSEQRGSKKSRELVRCLYVRRADGRPRTQRVAVLPPGEHADVLERLVRMRLDLEPEAVGRRG